MVSVRFHLRGPSPPIPQTDPQTGTVLYSEPHSQVLETRLSTTYSSVAGVLVPCRQSEMTPYPSTPGEPQPLRGLPVTCGPGVLDRCPVPGLNRRSRPTFLFLDVGREGRFVTRPRPPRPQPPFPSPNPCPHMEYLSPDSRGPFHIPHSVLWVPTLDSPPGRLKHRLTPTLRVPSGKGCFVRGGNGQTQWSGVKYVAREGREICRV